MKNNILIVVSHPDDEILWVWWTILKHIKNWDKVSCLILSNWEDSRWEEIADNEKRKKQTLDVSKAIWFNKLYIENLPDNKFDSIPLIDIVKKVEKVVFKLKPNIIYTHFSDDLNLDHRLTFQAVMTCCRPQPDFFVKEIYSFETLSSTEWQKKEKSKLFNPTKYINIEKTIDKKLELMSIYKDEIRNYPHPRSLEWIEILSKFRWLEVWYKNAEAFEVVRNLW